MTIFRSVGILPASISIILAMIGLLNCIDSFSYPFLAQSNIKPKRIRYTPTPPPPPSSNGTPNAKNTAGSRGSCPEIFSLGGNSGYTLTVSEYPTFWFYIPYSADEVSDIAFELQYKNGKPIDTILVTLPTNLSLIRIRLSKPLPTNQKLFWYLTFKCKSSSDLKISFIQGFVERILPDNELKNQLTMAKTPLERVVIYAENGIWYDTLAELLSQPNLQEVKNNFLKEVGLEDISQVF